MAKRFEGEYVRGGQRTLFLSRQDVVELLALLKAGRFDLQEMKREAAEMSRDLRKLAKQRALEQKIGEALS